MLFDIQHIIKSLYLTSRFDKFILYKLFLMFLLLYSKISLKN